MRILITGASGLLGVNLALEMAREHTVFGQINALPLKGAPFTQLSGDLLEDGAVEKMLEKARPDWVIHCAALADVDACEKEPSLARRLNEELPRRIAVAGKGRAKLLHISTDAVFDGSKELFTETDSPNPLSIYARTKLEGEKAVLLEDPSAIVARINIFGWSLFGTRSLAEWFFYHLQAGLPVKGFTDVFFRTQLASDLAGVFHQMFTRNLKGLYHAVGADCVSKYDFALQIARRMGASESLVSPVKVADFGLKAARSNNLCLDVSKLENALKHPINRLSTGLDRFFEQYSQRYPHLLRRMVDNSVEDLNPYMDGGKDGH
jgi:dTDP-4-dehydrorhamnose reductase